MIPADPSADTDFDARLRTLYEQGPLPPAFEPAPWPTVAARLSGTGPPARPPRTWRTALTTGAAGVLVGLWLGWAGGGDGGTTGAPAPVSSSSTGAITRTTPAARRVVDGRRLEPMAAQLAAAAPRRAANVRPLVAIVPATRRPVAGGSHGPAAQEPVTPKAAGGAPIAAPGMPLAPVVVLGGITTSPPVVVPALQPLVALGAELAGLPTTDSSGAGRERRRLVLRAQRAALLTLQRQTDSLLLAAGEVAAPERTDSVATRSGSRWSVLLAVAPERNFFGLNAPATDTLSAMRRTHEQGRGGYNALLLAEYRLNDRLSVGAGLGVASYGAELRLSEQRTAVSTRLDTAVSQTVQTGTTIAFAVHPVADSMLAPILNGNNQVIGYEYLPTTRMDTVWTHLTTTRVNTTTTYTPTVTTRQEVSARILKPNYRFVTVPILVRYRLGRTTDGTSARRAPRWWADVALGAQLQFFLGGTQVTTRDGLTYRTERVGPQGGPFRPWNLALTGAVAFNYALTPRLSASLAPTLRYQMESVYKASTNLTQRPAATGIQLGLKYAF